MQERFLCGGSFQESGVIQVLKPLPDVAATRGIQRQDLLGAQKTVVGDITQDFVIAGLDAELCGRLLATLKLLVVMERH